MFDITDKTTSLLDKMLDFTALRQKAIGSNIANVNTPGYKRVDVSFEKGLQEALGHNGDEEDTGLKVVTSMDGTEGAGMRADGNTVSMEKEMTELMKNSISYSSYIQMISKKFRMLREAITSR